MVWLQTTEEEKAKGNPTQQTSLARMLGIGNQGPLKTVKVWHSSPGRYGNLQGQRCLKFALSIIFHGLNTIFSAVFGWSGLVGGLPSIFPAVVVYDHAMNED